MYPKAKAALTMQMKPTCLVKQTRVISTSTPTISNFTGTDSLEELALIYPALTTIIASLIPSDKPATYGPHVILRSIHAVGLYIAGVEIRKRGLYDKPGRRSGEATRG